MACSSINDIPVLSCEDPVWESLSRDYRWDALGTVPEDAPVSIETLLAYATTDGNMSLEDFVRGKREEVEGLQVDYAVALDGINVMSPAMFADILLDPVPDLLDLDLLQSGQSNVVADLFKDFDMTSPTALEDLENLLANRRKFRFGTAVFSVNRDHRGCHVSVRGSKTNTEIQLSEREALDLLQLLVTDYCLEKADIAISEPVKQRKYLLEPDHPSVMHVSPTLHCHWVNGARNRCRLLRIVRMLTPTEAGKVICMNKLVLKDLRHLGFLSLLKRMILIHDDGFPSLTSVPTFDPYVTRLQSSLAIASYLATHVNCSWQLLLSQLSHI